MKVTATITAENLGERWTARFPVVDIGRCFPTLDGRMVAQPDECYAELSASDMIQGVKHDEKFLNQVVASWVRLVNGWKEDNCLGSGVRDYEKTMRRIHRRMDQGRVTHVRAVWHQCRDHVSFAVALDNGGVAEKRDYERYFAWKMVEAATVIDEDFRERGIPPIRFDETASALLAEFRAWSAERDAEKRLKALNEGRFVCERHRNGYCSPCKPDCPCFAAGKCVEAKEVRS